MAIRVATIIQSCCPCQTLTLMTSPCLTSILTKTFLLSLRANFQTRCTNEVRFSVLCCLSS